MKDEAKPEPKEAKTKSRPKQEAKKEASKEAESKAKKSKSTDKKSKESKSNKDDQKVKQKAKEPETADKAREKTPDKKSAPIVPKQPISNGIKAGGIKGLGGSLGGGMKKIVANKNKFSVNTDAKDLGQIIAKKNEASTVTNEV